MSWQEECKQLIAEGQLSTSLQLMEDKDIDVTVLREAYNEAREFEKANKPFTSTQYTYYIEEEQTLVQNMLNLLG